MGCISAVATAPELCRSPTIILSWIPLVHVLFHPLLSAGRAQRDGRLVEMYPLVAASIRDLVRASQGVGSRSKNRHRSLTPAPKTVRFWNRADRPIPARMITIDQ
jgi:hypothetical protein